MQPESWQVKISLCQSDTLWHRVLSIVGGRGPKLFTPPSPRHWLLYCSCLIKICSFFLLKGTGSNSASSPALSHTRACRSGQLPPKCSLTYPQSSAVISCHCKHHSDQQILLMKAVHGPHTFLFSDSQLSWTRHILYRGDLTLILTQSSSFPTHNNKT